MWRLPGDREKDSFWRHSVGVSAVKAAVQTPVMVYAWNGNKKVKRNPVNFASYVSSLDPVKFSEISSEKS